MTSSRFNTKKQEWQGFHYCPAIVAEREINYKNRANSKDNSSVLYCVGTRQLFFPPSRGSLDQSGFTLVQFTPHLKSHCLLELDLPDSFTQWMDSTCGEKKANSVWNCLRSQEVLDLSGAPLRLPLTFQSEECPHYRGGEEEERGRGEWCVRHRTGMTQRKHRNTSTSWGFLVLLQ